MSTRSRVDQPSLTLHWVNLWKNPFAAVGIMSSPPSQETEPTRRSRQFCRYVQML